MYYNSTGELHNLSFIRWFQRCKAHHASVIVPSELITDDEEKKALLCNLGLVLDAVYPERTMFKYYPVVKNLGKGLYSDDIAIAIESVWDPGLVHEHYQGLINAIEHGGRKLYRIMDAENYIIANRIKSDFICLLTVPEPEASTFKTAEINHLMKYDNPLFLEDFIRYAEKEFPGVDEKKLRELSSASEDRKAALEIAHYYYAIKAKYKPTGKMLEIEKIPGFDEVVIGNLKRHIAWSEMDDPWSIQEAVRYAFKSLDLRSEGMKNSIEYQYEIADA